MRALILAWALSLPIPAWAADAVSDYAREQRWADEILPAVLTGDPVWLTQADGHRFLTLYTAAPPAKAAVILAHGSGVHPDWGLIGMLRQALPEAGYTTLSLQMPVLAADAPGDAYRPTFDLAAERLALAVEHLKRQGHTKIALVTHSLGGRMAYRYLTQQPDSAVRAWVALSMAGDADLSRLKLPILDLHGERDLPGVLNVVAARKQMLTQVGSAQQRLAGADHFHEGQDKPLLDAIRDYLDKAIE